MKCSECIHYEKCEWFLSKRGDEEVCDWLPTKFKPKDEKDEQEMTGSKIPIAAEKDAQRLINTAREVSKNAWAHISKFNVGCAIKAKNGRIYTGVNVEFDNMTNTIHAEMCAIGNMVADGQKDMIMMAVYTPDKKAWFPCGYCRQSIFEISKENMIVIACNDTTARAKTIGELLPEGFKSWHNPNYKRDKK